MSSTGHVSQEFSDFSLHFEQEKELRDRIRECVTQMDHIERNVAGILAGIHRADGYAHLADTVKQAETLIRQDLVLVLAKLADTVPHGQFYKFHSSFCHGMQRSVYLAAMTLYLKDERLIMKNEAAQWLGLAASPDLGHFHLDLEDYLSGLTQLSNELSRLAMNAVTHGDYDRPQRIAAFLNHLLSAFRLLNLKNDALRKRFDSLKYDMRKVEQVVYDLSIRGLQKTDAQISDHPKEADKPPCATQVVAEEH